jgi:hypothetical protein
MLRSIFRGDPSSLRRLLLSIAISDVHVFAQGEGFEIIPRVELCWLAVAVSATLVERFPYASNFASRVSDSWLKGP